MRMLVISLFATFSSSAFARSIHCELENNYGFDLVTTATGVDVTVDNLGTHTFARELNLPNAGQEYKYTRATFHFANNDCRFSGVDSVVTRCETSGAATLALSWPAVDLSLSWLRINAQKITVDDARWGQSQYYRLELAGYETSQHLNFSEPLDFNLDWCQVN